MRLWRLKLYLAIMTAFVVVFVVVSVAVVGGCWATRFDWPGGTVGNPWKKW